MNNNNDKLYVLKKLKHNTAVEIDLIKKYPIICYFLAISCRENVVHVQVKDAFNAIKIVWANFVS